MRACRHALIVRSNLLPCNSAGRVYGILMGMPRGGDYYLADRRTCGVQPPPFPVR